MAPSTPTGVPSRLRAGDTWRWRVADFSDYPQSEGWALSYRLIGPDTREITAAWQSSGDDANHWLINETTTTDVPRGRYRIIGYVDGSGAYAGRRHVVSEDLSVDVLANPETVQPAELGTHAERTLELIEAAIEGRVPSGMESYSIGGRSVTKIALSELVRLRGHYTTLVKRERTGRIGRTVYAEARSVS